MQDISYLLSFPECMEQFQIHYLFDPLNNPGKSENRDEESKFTEEKMEAFCAYATRGKSQKSD